MGIRASSLSACCSPEIASRRYDAAFTDSLHDGLVHAYSYVRSDPAITKPKLVGNDAVHSQTRTFLSISGASVSANPSTAALSPSLTDACPNSASVFESSGCFASIPLQPMPRGGSDIATRALSLAGANDHVSSPKSGLVEKKEKKRQACKCDQCHKTSISQRTKISGPKSKSKKKRQSPSETLISFLNRLISLKNAKKQSIKEQFSQSNCSILSNSDWNTGSLTRSNTSSTKSISHSAKVSSSGDENGGQRRQTEESRKLQWAQGKAGEDRVHIVFSEENGWIFVGIYDGFNGPDAPDYLLNNLYQSVHKELKGLLWNDKFESSARSSDSEEFTLPCVVGNELSCITSNEMGFKIYDSDKENRLVLDLNVGLDAEALRLFRQRRRDKVAARSARKQQWKCEWDRERQELDRILKEQLNCQKASDEDHSPSVNHNDVLRALSRALKANEEAFLELGDAEENPELALMGSCVLVMLMKGEDLYLMNVGDSRAVLAQTAELNLGLGARKQNLDAIDEETKSELEAFSGVDDEDGLGGLPTMAALQLTMEHSTNVEEEVERIRRRHPDDASAVENERVKGYLKVTRAFGAGFLKQPKWNNALLEAFRLKYIGDAPYITCSPSLRHHRLTLRDKFLILSSDGLYEYFSNEEVVFEVESFIATCPDADPAQHLIEEVLYRAARKYGMDFNELLEIPQGDRRRYHDDVSVIIISLEGRIWRSSM